MTRWMRSSVTLLVAVMLFGMLGATAVADEAPADAEPANAAMESSVDSFGRVWARTDHPVSEGAVSRTWMWGPQPVNGVVWEDYQQSPGGQRQVQYYDKSRMEITNPDAVDDGLWYVTNGLLVVEMMTGKMQVGNDEFVTRFPAQVNVAGDPDDPLTYAVLAQRRSDAPVAVGSPITQRINANGQISDDPTLAERGVTSATHVVETNHTVASVFWAFMNSSGLIDHNGQFITDKLFDNPFYATGLPITEAYWANVKIGGTQREVLLQCFERRCLTFTPGNPEGWQVEAGNVGLHYYQWRYGQQQVEEGPSDKANELATAVRGATTPESRIDALLDVLDALHIGVYGTDGAQILGGAERGAADFYLYDFEVQMMAGALERGQTWGVVDLAMQLSTLGYVPEGQALDPGIVRQAILGGVANAKAAPGEFTSLSPLLLRQLGLYQNPSYDLFGSPALQDMRFDALGFLLLLGEMTVPGVQDELPAEGGVSNLIADSNGVLTATAVAQSTPCDPPSAFNGDAFKDAWGWSKIYAELVSLVPDAAARVTVVLDALHGAILAFSVGVTELDQRLETHYGHDGAGESIVFRVKVEMRDELPQALVDCGWIVGTTFPPKGPIQGVSVHWFWDKLSTHGTIACGNACPSFGTNGVSIDATGADGIARMTFTPFEEEKPGEGWVVEEHGIVTGVALYQSKFTNLLGAYGQYLTPKSGATRWVVRWHEPPGWNVTMNVAYDVDTEWKHIGFDSGNDYFLETASSSGAMTFKVFIPAYAVDQQGNRAATAVSTGSGSGKYTSTDYSKYSAYWHWEWNCGMTFSGGWSNAFLYKDIYSDASGKRFVVPGQFLPPWEITQASGSTGGGGPCGAHSGHLYVEKAILTNIPIFTLDQQGEQEYTVNSGVICDAIRADLIKYWNTVPDQPGVVQDCDVDIEWTIDVQWGDKKG